MALINGREYEWADISLILGGRDMIGIRSIKYSTKQDKELLYGKGNMPLSIQRGNISFEGEISVSQSELESLKLLAREKTAMGNIMGLSLNAVVCYGNPSKGDAMITDRLFGIQFTQEEKSMSQGDKSMEISLPFICTKIDYQTA